jgi:hypothetical protein
MLLVFGGKLFAEFSYYVTDILCLKFDVCLRVIQYVSAA